MTWMRHAAIGTLCLFAIVWTWTVAAQQSPGTPASSSDESLGEIAKKARAKKPQAARRVFTDDDVAHATTTAADDREGFDQRLQNAQRVMDDRAAKTARQLSNEVAGNTQFPGRDVWQDSLFVQHGKLIAAARAALDAAKKMSNGPTAAERASARTATDKLLADLDSQTRRYAGLVAEGVRNANEWERRAR